MAERAAIFVSQRAAYPDVCTCLGSGKPLKKKSPFLSLNPFLDDQLLLRVGGRLQNANLPFDRKFPLILLASCHFVAVLVRHLHLRFFHAQKSFLLAHLRSKFWFYGNITRVVKKCIHNCVTCVRYDAVPAEQLMGDLPSERVTVSRPFTNVGVDLSLIHISEPTRPY